jgi:hypothetical protein
MQGKAWIGKERQGKTGKGKARQGKASQCKPGQGWASKERKGKAMQVMARQERKKDVCEYRRCNVIYRLTRVLMVFDDVLSYTCFILKSHFF